MTITITTTPVTVGTVNTTQINVSVLQPASVVNGVPSGGTINQVLAKNSSTDYDTKWVSGGAGGGTVDSVVAGANIGVDSTDAANPIVSLDSDIDVTSVTADKHIYDVTYTKTGAETSGQSFFDSDYQTISTVLPDGTTLQHGQEIGFYGKNTSGAIIYNGQAVSISGVGGSFNTFALTDITSDSSAQRFVGIATQDIAINGWGKVTTHGTVNDINTNGLVEGGILYVSATPGVLTQTRPTPPLRICAVGGVQYAHASNGRITVSPVKEPKFTELSDATPTPPSTDGLVPSWDNVTKLWVYTNNVSDMISTVNKSTVGVYSGLKLDSSLTGTVRGTTAAIAGQIRAVPFSTPVSFNISALSISVSSAATTGSYVALLGLYASDSTCAPYGAPLASGEVSGLDSTGEKSVAVSYTLQKGVQYWLTCMTNCNATLHSIPVSAAPIIGLGSATGTAKSMYLAKALTYASGNPSPIQNYVALSDASGSATAFSIMLTVA